MRAEAAWASMGADIFRIERGSSSFFFEESHTISVELRASTPLQGGASDDEPTAESERASSVEWMRVVAQARNFTRSPSWRGRAGRGSAEPTQRPEGKLFAQGQVS